MAEETRGVAQWLAVFHGNTLGEGRIEAALATARALSEAAARESAALAMEDEPAAFAQRLAARAAK